MLKCDIFNLKFDHAHQFFLLFYPSNEMFQGKK